MFNLIIHETITAITVNGRIERERETETERDINESLFGRFEPTTPMKILIGTPRPILETGRERETEREREGRKNIKQKEDKNPSSVCSLIFHETTPTIRADGSQVSYTHNHLNPFQCVCVCVGV